MKTMKHFSHWLSASAAIILSALIASCSSSDNDAEGIWAEPVAQSAPLHFVAQLDGKSSIVNNAKAVDLGEDFGDDGVELSAKHNAPRRVIVSPGENDETLDAKWATGEQVGLIYKVDDVKYLTPATVTATTGEDGIATIEGTLEYAPTTDTPVKIVYPLAAADETEESGIKAGYLKDGQDGTIETISNKFDVATADGILAVNGTNATLKNIVSLENQYAILRLRFTAGGSPIEKIHRLYVTDPATNTDIITVKGSNMSTYYAVMEPVTTSTILRFTIISDAATYTNTARLTGLEPSMYYRSSLSLNASGAGAVDLGLPSRTLWATCNVGAENYAPEAYGDFFAWGETTGYSSANNPPTDGRSFDWDGYTKSFGTYDSSASPDYGFTKYNTTTPIPILQAAHDAATVNWGRIWRMPTYAEWDELLTAYPSSTASGSKRRAWLADYNGVAGLAFYDASDNVLFFLPAAGFRSQTSLINQRTAGRYWSSSLYTTDVQIAWYLSLNRDGDKSFMSYNGGRCNGRSVRPIVADKSTN